MEEVRPSLRILYSNKGKGKMNLRHFIFVLFSFHVIPWICNGTWLKVMHSDTECEYWGRHWEERSSMFCHTEDASGILQIISRSPFPCHTLLHAPIFFCWQKVWRIRNQLHLREVSSGRENWRSPLSNPFTLGRMFCLHHEVLNWFWMPLQLTEVPWH